MTHRLGSVVAVSPALPINSTAGVAAGAGRRKITFSGAAGPTSTKFLMLHFTAASLKPGDRIEVDLVYDTDVFTAASGGDFWSRPIKGNSVDILFVDGGTATGAAQLSEFGRGEGLQGGGGTNTNADIFLIDSPYQEPTFFNSAGVCTPAGSGPAPHWRNVETLPAGIMRDTARSVGMFIEVHEGSLSSCSAALIGPDLILTAAHCVSDATVVPTGAFTLDYQTDAAGNRPAGYNPKFFKFKRIVKSGWEVPPVGMGPPNQLDYGIVQVETPPGGFGVPPLALRTTPLVLNEDLFVIHHPRGVVKKVSAKPANPQCQVKGVSGGVVTYGCDSDNGSSGSPVFDMSGRIVAVNDWAPAACGNQGQAASDIAVHMLAAAPPAKDVDVVLVLDRSGSMSQLGFTGVRSKIEEARRAAALFIDLVRTDKTHRAGLVSFSTAASSPPEFALAAVTDPNKTTLIGPPPARNAGILAAVAPGGNTTIGGGLQAGRNQLPAPSPAANTPVILLLTDGLENTAPTIASVEPALANARLNIIGFGSEGSVDGPRLTTLARNHDGIYTRSGEGLELKKFFVLSFGNIFNTGIAVDPIFVLDENVTKAPAIPVSICGEERMTVVLAWEDPSDRLILTVFSPGGNAITDATAGIAHSSGDSWVHFRINLPFHGERDGIWEVSVTRLSGGGEFPPPLPEERFFVTVTVDGGPYFRPAEMRRLYTGDTVNPRVILRDHNGFAMEHADVSVDIKRPNDGTGNILTQSGLQAAGNIGGDFIDARTNTLLALEQASGGTLITTTTETIPLFDDGELDGDGTLEPDGIFGNPQPDLLRREGTYEFHAHAVYGEECRGVRETAWSVYVSVGIDPGTTTVTSDPLGPGPGCERLRLTFTPRDRYGNHVGPGRGDSFAIVPRPGSTLTGAVTDLGNGSYTQEICWDPTSVEPPGFGIDQPDRPTVVVTGAPPPVQGRFIYSVKFVCGVAQAHDCNCAPVVAGVYATEINIHNFQVPATVIEKHVIPLVFAGAAVGREPRFAGRKFSEKMELPGLSATMDDCCRIAEMLLGAPPSGPSPLTIGFLEIISPVELAVTAVYTVNGPNGRTTSIDVETIEPRRIQADLPVPRPTPPDQPTQPRGGPR
jgi:hypothetical protein